MLQNNTLKVEWNIKASDINLLKYSFLSLLMTEYIAGTSNISPLELQISWLTLITITKLHAVLCCMVILSYYSYLYTCITEKIKLLWSCIARKTFLSQYIFMITITSIRKREIKCSLVYLQV